VGRHHDTSHGAPPGRLSDAGRPPSQRVAFRQTYYSFLITYTASTTPLVAKGCALVNGVPVYISVWKQLLLLCLLAGTAYGGFEAYKTYLAPDAVTEAPSNGARPVTVELAVAETRLLQHTIEAVGTTRALQSIEIVPEVDGRLVELAIEPGAEVQQGAILARLDDTIQRADLVEAVAILTERRHNVERRGHRRG
jgi:hypothetical protein